MLCCGDAKSDTDFRRLIGRERAVAVFAAPPYNVTITSVQGRGRIRHREFLQASGEMSAEAYTRFLVDALSLAAKFSVSGSLHYICNEWRHLGEMEAAGKQRSA